MLIILTFTPATNAKVHFPDLNMTYCNIQCNNEEEHAVSTVILGPDNPKINDKRLAVIAADDPGARYGLDK